MTEQPQAEKFSQKLWRWFIEPSAQIIEQDKRRQASLLSGLLLGLIITAILIEILTVSLLAWENYTGYRQTFVAVLFLGIVYAISRTKHTRLAARLAVIVASVAVFITSWAQPKGALGGLFDFIILPLWLGSLYLGLTELIVLMIANLIGLLLFPLTTDVVTLSDILVGPFSFIFATSILLIVMTRHRNRLENDRRKELAEREKRSRREAARTKALLRVASRLNAQLDQDTLLNTLSEEAVRAVNASIAIVTLYDQRHEALFPVAGAGVRSDIISKLSPLEKNIHDQNIVTYGNVFSVDSLENFPLETQLESLINLRFQSIAVATMEYEQELVGSLSVVMLKQPRNFAEHELLLLRGIADQAALAIINTRLYKDARRRLENLQALRAIDTAIAANHDLQKTLEVVLDNVINQLNVDAAIVLIFDESKQVLEYAASKGLHTSAFRYTRLQIGQGIAGRAAQRNQIISIPDLRADPQTLVSATSLKKEGFISYFAVPLSVQSGIKGVLEILHRSQLDPDDEWLAFLEILGGQAAIAIESTSLFEDLQKTNDELSKAYDSTIEGWSHALDLRDKETEGHTLRVTELTLELARRFEFSEAELTQIRRGALLHDIGKMAVPDKILLKESSLDSEEWKIMQQHPVHAHEMLRSIEYLRPALDIPYRHHEKWDGTGYPDRLQGEEIPLSARIFALADVWDALTSNRPYRSAWTHEKALEYIEEQKGKHFDPQVAEEFIKLIKQKMN